MSFTFAHNNINVSDIDRAVKFYQDALDLQVVREKVDPEGRFKIVFMGDGVTGHRLELTCLYDHPQPYELGENEIHLALTTDDLDAAHARHEAMGCICYENPKMGIYFIEDPDGYWVEIVPKR